MNLNLGLPALSTRRPSWPRVTARPRSISWSRVALPALLLVTAAAYVWDLSASGNANSFYAAAVQAGTKSWKAFFFGSLDSSNFITVDKPPASLWVMALSGRLFGYSSWSMLLPQALEGVATVWLLYAAIKRWFGTGVGLAAGALLALTPVAALMFRFNNPDALLVLLLVAAAYCLTRAIETASTRWMMAVGTMIGFAFLAKMMQAFLVLPGFGLVYLVAAPTGVRRRVPQLLYGAGAMVVSAGWWVAIVALWPAGSRPMIDGSSNNSILNLITGYNGLGRIFGASGPGGGGGGGGGANFSGSTGLLRLFNTAMGAQASWLLPAALLTLVAGVWVTRRAPRIDRTRAALLLWGGWLVVSGLVFSLGRGVIHTYYTVALVPAIAALVAIGGRMVWDRRASVSAKTLAVTGLVVTAGWSWVLLDRTPQWAPWLRTLVVITAVAALCGLVVASIPRSWARRLALPAVILAVTACLAGPVAYAAQTIATAHTGSIPSAGPGDGTGMGGAGGPRGSGMSGGGGPRGSGMSAGGGPGQTRVGTALERALSTDASSYRWVAATSGSESAASLELATGGEPVMAIGGFNNQGGNLTLSRFKTYVARGEIHYYLASGGGAVRGGPGSGAGRPTGAPRQGAAQQDAAPSFAGGGAPRAGGMGMSDNAVTSWVAAHFKKVTIGGQTVYDLTQRTV